MQLGLLGAAVGVAARYVQALQTHAFSALGMQRLEIVVAVGNTASAAVAHKAGAELESVACNRLQLHGQAVAAQVFSLLPPTMAAGLKAVSPPPAQ